MPNLFDGIDLSAKLAEMKEQEREDIVKILLSSTTRLRLFVEAGGELQQLARASFIENAVKQLVLTGELPSLPEPSNGLPPADIGFSIEEQDLLAFARKVRASPELTRLVEKILDDGDAFILGINPDGTVGVIDELKKKLGEITALENEADKTRRDLGEAVKNGLRLGSVLDAFGIDPKKIVDDREADKAAKSVSRNLEALQKSTEAEKARADGLQMQLDEVTEREAKLIEAKKALEAERDRLQAELDAAKAAKPRLFGRSRSDEPA